MSLKQIIVKNATTMSLHERFTKICRTKETSSSNERVMQQLASSRNRRLAQQMEKRPAVAAALNKKGSIKNRLGLPGAISVRERLRLPRGFGLRRGGGGGSRGSLAAGKSPLTRSFNRGIAAASSSNISAGVLPVSRSRGRSPFISNKIQRRSRSRSRSMLGLRSRSRSRARSRSTGGGGGGGNTRNRSRSRSTYRERSISGMQYFPVRKNTIFRRGRGGGSRRQIVRAGAGDLKFYRPKLGNDNGNHSSRMLSRNRRYRGNTRFRNNIRGRGSYLVNNAAASTSAGRGRPRRNRLPTKEELDRELDQYMSTTKANLDKELDTMMNDETWN